MPLPHLPTRDHVNTQADLDRLWWYVKDLRDSIEGRESGQSVVIETLFNNGLVPAPRSLILDGGFERNRNAWALHQGYTIFESDTLSRTGNYCVACTTADANSFAIANQSLKVDCRPGDVVVIHAWARRAASGTASARVLIAGYDKDDVLVGIQASTPASLTTTYQLLSAVAVIPATVTKLLFGVQCTAISGSTAYFDDVSAFFLPYQDQHTEATGPTNFTSETIIGTVNIGAGRETGWYDVIVQALTTIQTANADNTYRLRIRRYDESSIATSPVLAGSDTGDLGALGGLSGVRVPVMGFDSDPNTLTQNYILTAEKTAGTGTPSAHNTTMLVSQRNLLAF